MTVLLTVPGRLSILLKNVYGQDFGIKAYWKYRYACKCDFAFFTYKMKFNFMYLWRWCLIAGKIKKINANSGEL